MPTKEPVSKNLIRPKKSIVSGDIDAIINEIKSDELAKKSTEKTLDLESLRQFWNDYAERQTASSIKMALKNVKLDFSDQTILVTVPSELIKEKVIAEKQLMINIREEYNNDIILKIDINLDLFPDYKTIPIKRYLTIEDKYNALSEKNANLDKLVRKFQLKIDEK